jgi:tetratricopeptide (TPR) repeat protein
MKRSAPVAALLLLPLFVVPLPGAKSADPAELRWRTDYNEARREAEAKGLPLFVKVGTDACIYCRKMDATTFADAQIRATLGTNFVAVMLDGNAEPGFVKALQIQLYPTCVLAGADGKIHQVLGGYQGPDAMKAALQQSITTARAEAVVRAATGATKRSPERSREVLNLAKEAYREEHFATCIEHCEYVVAGYADSAEGREAAALLAGLRADAKRLAAAADELSERAAATQAAVAAAYAKTGDTQSATRHYEKAVRANPEGKAALAARDELAKLIAVPASRMK